MIPNLTIIVAVYCVIRLATLALKQFPSAAGAKATRATIASFAASAIVLIVICTLDTIGVGLSVGTTLDSKRSPASYNR